MPPKVPSTTPDATTQAVNNLMQLVHTLSDKIASMEVRAEADRSALLAAQQSAENDPNTAVGSPSSSHSNSIS